MCSIRRTQLVYPVFFPGKEITISQPYSFLCFNITEKNLSMKQFSKSNVSILNKFSNKNLERKKDSISISYPYTVSYDYEIITQIDFTQGLFPKMCRHTSISMVKMLCVCLTFFFLLWCWCCWKNNERRKHVRIYKMSYVYTYVGFAKTVNINV